MQCIGLSVSVSVTYCHRIMYSYNLFEFWLTLCHIILDAFLLQFVPITELGWLLAYLEQKLEQESRGNISVDAILSLSTLKKFPVFCGLCRSL